MEDELQLLKKLRKKGSLCIALSCPLPSCPTLSCHILSCLVLTSTLFFYLLVHLPFSSLLLSSLPFSLSSCSPFFPFLSHLFSSLPFLSSSHSTFYPSLHPNTDPNATLPIKPTPFPDAPKETKSKDKLIVRRLNEVTDMDLRKRKCRVIVRNLSFLGEISDLFSFLFCFC